MWNEKLRQMPDSPDKSQYQRGYKGGIHALQPRQCISSPAEFFLERAAGEHNDNKDEGQVLIHPFCQ
mgnify:CR=1 FL=1